MLSETGGAFERPLPNAHFSVHIDGVPMGFCSVSALQSDVLDAKPAEPPTVVLTRAVSRDDRLFRWFDDARHGKEVARTVEVCLLGEPGGDALQCWQLQGARPVRWIGPCFDALASDIACESLEIRYDHIHWTN